jgi:hypothetical protein
MTSVTGGIDSIEFAMEKILIKAGVWMKMEEENCGKKILGQFFFLMCIRTIFLLDVHDWFVSVTNDNWRRRE